MTKRPARTGRAPGWAAGGGSGVFAKSRFLRYSSRGIYVSLTHSSSVLADRADVDLGEQARDQVVASLRGMGAIDGVHGSGWLVALGSVERVIDVDAGKAMGLPPVTFHRVPLVVHIDHPGVHLCELLGGQAGFREVGPIEVAIVDVDDPEHRRLALPNVRGRGDTASRIRAAPSVPCTRPSRDRTEPWSRPGCDPGTCAGSTRAGRSPRSGRRDRGSPSPSVRSSHRRGRARRFPRRLSRPDCLSHLP